MKSENRLQQECFNWHWNKYPAQRKLLFHVPNGGTRNAREGKTLKLIGVVAGVADLVYLHNGITYFFELKTEIGKQSQKQISWQNIVTANGFKYFIIRDIEYFKGVIEYINTKI